MMVIGAFRLSFAVPEEGSTHKGEAQRIKDHMWSQYKISICELDSDPQELIIGGAVVGPSESACRQRVDKIIEHMRDWPKANLVHEESDFIAFEDIEVERDFEKYQP